MADALGAAKATISYELDRVKPYDPELSKMSIVKDGIVVAIRC